MSRHASVGVVAALWGLAAMMPGARADRVSVPVPREGPLDPRFATFVNDRVAPLFDTPTTTGTVRGHLARHQRYAVARTARGPGCTRLWLEIARDRWACGDFGAMTSAAPHADDQTLARTPQGLPWTYAFTARDHTAVYASAADARAGAHPRATWEANWGFGVRNEFGERGDERVLESVEGFYLRRADVYRAEPSDFEGAALAGVSLASPPRIGWISEGATFAYGSPADGARERRSLGRVARLTPVRLLREAREGRWTWAEIEPGRWVRRDRVRAVQGAEAPAELVPGERWVDIDRAEQTLVAYEGRRAVFATMVSTGRERNETPPGVFRTWARYLSRTMDNTENAGISGHFRMGDVPWVQFFDADRGLHAVYWHDDFGHARSHGCVNLSPRDAERLFRWARPGVPLGWQSVFMPDREGMIVRIR